MSEEKDYVLGTHDAEVERLGLQHRVWRARALDAWRRGGFRPGHRIIDVGSGPGFATRDLAGIVGNEGEVISVDRSGRFLDVLRHTAEADGMKNVRVVEADLNEESLPALGADGAWVRWVFAFVHDPRALLQKIYDALRPGGTLVVHEYYHYETWRMSPRNEAFEEFVRRVMESWRANGGEPDVGLSLPLWMREIGFEVRETRQFSDFVTSEDFMWEWPKAFLDVGLQRLEEIGHIGHDRAREVREAYARLERDDGFMVIPSVVELVAKKIERRTQNAERRT